MTKQTILRKQNPEAFKAQRRRNNWLALALVAFVVIMGIGTAIRIQDGSGVSACEGSFYWDMNSNSCVQGPAEPDLDSVSAGGTG